MATGGRDEFRSGNNPDGTIIPNRIFVGGISENTDEDDLWELFSKYGEVKSTNIVLDKAGISRGYGFVTFETEEDARKVLADNEQHRLILHGRNLNIAKAVKKQPYGRASETSSAHSAPIVWPTQAYSGSPAGFSRDSVYYPQTTWPFMWPQFYLQQQCQYPPTAQSGYPQYIYSLAPPSDYPYAPAAPGASSDYSEASSADSVESVKSRPKQQPVSTSATDYERGRQSRSKISAASQSSGSTSSITRSSTGSAEAPASYMHSAPVHHMHHPVFATKTINGVAVMAYPRSFVMGSPVIHVKDGDSDNVFSELGYLQSPITPPATPLASIPCDFGSNAESIR
ncbi:hypothetical protein JTE90_017987 [Oedothorax gibbosus]|uniref:RRM domain-containing protein n=1 Tax=Oedothorax gibbosus TaxID=931172 RepID=A0AAV6V7M4_9ARAC|nr:hypothetical protein JTE90_017987 [Oedothorax gibbosus]